MGKYQLDTKGKASISKFHEKNSLDKTDKKQRALELREKFLKNKKK